MGEESDCAGQKTRPALKGLGHKTKAFASEVYAAVRTGKLAQPFSGETAKRACPGRSEATYRNFFNKYRVGNPGGMAKLFVRRACNRFEIIDSTETRPASRERKLDDGEAPRANDPRVLIGAPVYAAGEIAEFPFVAVNPD